MEHKNNYQASALRRVAKELALNPDKYRELGGQGGLARVSKGIGKLTKERRTEIANLGQAARQAQRIAAQDEVRVAAQDESV